jgi:hypothetical protein
MPGIEPAIDYLEHFEARLPERKGARFFLAAVTGVTFDTDVHVPETQFACRRTLAAREGA